MLVLAVAITTSAETGERDFYANPVPMVEVCLKHATRAEVATNMTQRALRPFYVHVPKCGSSFAYPLAATHCPWYDNNELHQLLRMVLHPDPVCVRRMSRFEPGHAPIPLRASSHDIASVVTVVRHPHERIASGFLHHFHDCPLMARELNVSSRPVPDVSEVARWEQYSQDRQLVLKYARCAAGYTGCMFTPSDGRCARGSTRPRAVDVASVLVKMRSFAFIGIQEQWEKSLCLYNAMYGRPGVSSRVLHHFRANAMPAHLKENIVRILQEEGFRDLIDEAVYRHALIIFNRNVRRYL